MPPCFWIIRFVSRNKKFLDDTQLLLDGSKICNWRKIFLKSRALKLVSLYFKRTGVQAKSCVVLMGILIGSTLHYFISDAYISHE